MVPKAIKSVIRNVNLNSVGTGNLSICDSPLCRFNLRHADDDAAAVRLSDGWRLRHFLVIPIQLDVARGFLLALLGNFSNEAMSLPQMRVEASGQRNKVLEMGRLGSVLV
jgi:hypothetical protein